MRTVPKIKGYLRRLDESIKTEFIPAVTGAIICSDAERELLSLRPKYGGLGIPIFSNISEKEFEYSNMLSKE